MEAGREIELFQYSEMFMCLEEPGTDRDRDRGAVACCFGQDDVSIHRWRACVGWARGDLRLLDHCGKDGRTKVKPIISRHAREGDVLTCLDMSKPNGEVLVTGYKSGYIEIFKDVWNTEKNQQPRSHLIVQDALVNSVAFFPNSQSKIVLAGKRGILRTFDLARDDSIVTHATLHNQNPIIQAVPLSEHTVVTVGTSRSARLIDLRDSSPNGIIIARTESWFYCADAHESSPLVACGDRNKTAIIADIRSAKNVQTVYHGAGVTTCAFSENDELLFTGSSDQTAAIWSVESGETLVKIGGNFRNGISCVDMSKDRQLGIITCHDGTAVVVDLAYYTRMKTKELESSAKLPAVIGERVCSFLW